MRLILLTTIFLITWNDLSLALTCKGCTSTSDPGVENGRDIVCEDTPENAPSVQCQEEYGFTHCYQMLLINKQNKNIEWNRKCCLPKEGSIECPTDKPIHETTDEYEVWRVRCQEDDCNIEDPRTASAGGGGDGGGILVLPGSEASFVRQDSVFVVVTLVLALMMQLL